MTYLCEFVCQYAMDVGVPEYSGITNGTCGNCDHYTPEPPRWKVACINWGHDDAPHATSYRLVNGEARHIAYHPDWDRAMARALRLARRFASVGEEALYE